MLTGKKVAKITEMSNMETKLFIDLFKLRDNYHI